MLIRGALEALAVVAAFVVFGTGLAVWARPAPYPPEAVLWLVDGFNVLHAGVLGGRDRSGWWTAARREELLARVEGFEEVDAEVWVVFDGPGAPQEPPDERPVRALFAPSADDWLLRRVREAAAEARAVTVVTADRSLADRARHRGARVVSPRAFLALCDRGADAL